MFYIYFFSRKEKAYYQPQLFSVFLEGVLKIDIIWDVQCVL